jgi:hypothetical protein
VTLIADLEDFVHDHRPPRPLDRRRHEARVERLLAHGGVLVCRGVWRWITPGKGTGTFKLRRASIFVWMTNRVRRLRWRSIISLLTTALILTGCARGVLDVSFLAPTTNTDGSSLTDVAAYRVYYGTAAAPCPGERAIIAAAPKVPLSPDQPLEVRLTRLTIGQLYYVAVTAVNSRGIESACTNTERARARRP